MATCLLNAASREATAAQRAGEDGRYRDAHRHQANLTFIAHTAMTAEAFLFFGDTAEDSPSLRREARTLRLVATFDEALLFSDEEG